MLNMRLAKEKQPRAPLVVFVEGGSKVAKHEYYKLSEKLARYFLFLQAMVNRMVTITQGEINS
jgi:hypothetical protein